MCPWILERSFEAKRLGVLAGQIEVPEDFDRMGEEEIQAMHMDQRMGSTKMKEIRS
ncbi:MAG: hypothetical protein R6U55_16200 [Desulfovermiculus sp.]